MPAIMAIFLLCINSTVLALVVSGSNVYAGGAFTVAGSATVNRVARWNGNNWSSLSGGVDDVVNALGVSGSIVYVGGDFREVCGDPTCSSGNVRVNYIAKWNGGSWSALGNGVSHTRVYAQ